MLRYYADALRHDTVMILMIAFFFAATLRFLVVAPMRYYAFALAFDVIISSCLLISSLMRAALSAIDIFAMRR